MTLAQRTGRDSLPVLEVVETGDRMLPTIGVGEDGQPLPAPGTLRPTVVTTDAEVDVTEDDSPPAILAAANPNRVRLEVQVHGDAFVRVARGSAASATTGYRLAPQLGGYVIEPDAQGYIYRGEVTAVRETAGTVKVGVVEEEPA